MLLGNANFDKFTFDFIERNIVIIGFRLGLEKYDRANISTALCFHRNSFLFQTALHLDRTRNNIVRRAMIIYDNGQFYHICPFEFDCVDKTDDIALSTRGGCQVENETRIDSLKHIHAQISFEVVAFIDDNDWIEIG